MKTFIITEVRQNEKNKTFEVQTKIEFRNLAALIKHLESNSQTLWNPQTAKIKEVTRFQPVNAPREDYYWGDD